MQGRTRTARHREGIRKGEREVRDCGRVVKHVFISLCAAMLRLHERRGSLVAVRKLVHTHRVRNERNRTGTHKRNKIKKGKEKKKKTTATINTIRR